MAPKTESGGFTWINRISAGDGSTIDWLLGSVQAGETQMAALKASDEAATGIVQRYAQALRPFGLYLRSFEVEALRAAAPPWIGGEIGYVEFINAPSAVERCLATAFASRIDMITVAHPGNRFVRPDPGWLPRLQVEDTEWRSVVARLMQLASIIVVELIHLSPGLREELALLAAAGVQPRTVLVLDNGHSDEARQRRLQQQMFGRPVDATPIDPADPAVRAFRRVLDVADFSAEAPQLADLLHEAAFVRGLDTPRRRARNDALGLADTAAQLLATVAAPKGAAARRSAMERVAQAATLGLRARGALAPLQDAVSLAGVCTLLALATAMLGDQAKVHDAIDWLMDAAAGLTDAERAGLVLRLRSLPNVPVLDPVQAQHLQALFPTLPPPLPEGR